jgi:RNA polymerase-binding transcription factor DksA
MSYRQPMRERLETWAEKTLLCTLRRQHQIKMDSHGHCYRCGKKIER